MRVKPRFMMSPVVRVDAAFVVGSLSSITKAVRLSVPGSVPGMLSCAALSFVQATASSSKDAAREYMFLSFLLSY